MEQVGVYQNEWELYELIRPYQDLDVYAALEIGAMYGGSLRHWMDRGTTVVVIGDEMRNAEEWEQWAQDAGSTLVLLKGFSQNKELVWRAHDLGPYQFVFIDGDHSYEGVKADWENYRTMVAKDGVVAFHDIAQRPGYGVSEVWAEIKTEPGTRTMEIIQNERVPGMEGLCGIGVVWL